MDIDKPNDGDEGVDFTSGPLSVLYKAVRGNTQVLVNVRNNHKLLGRVKAFVSQSKFCFQTLLLPLKFIWF